MTLDDMTLRELQKECVRALSTMQATNNNIYQFNKLAYHDSQKWYRGVIEWYINEYGDLPSRVGPGKDVKLIMDN